jgi:hypothetical protein
VVANQSAVTPAPSQPTKTDTTKIDIENYVFQSEFRRSDRARRSDQKPRTDTLPAKTPPVENNVQIDSALMPSMESKAPEDTFLLPKQRNYDLAFSTDYFVTQLDNSLQNSTYQAYTGGAFYFDPGLNALIKVGISDLMDDYKLSGGIRMSGDFNSNEYFLGYENLKYRTDRSFAFYRQAREFVDGFSYYKVHTHEGKAMIKYPFNDLTSLRGSMSFRTDRVVNKATDYVSLVDSTRYDYWGSVKAEYVF